MPVAGNSGWFSVAPSSVAPEPPAPPGAILKGEPSAWVVKVNVAALVPPEPARKPGPFHGRSVSFPPFPADPPRTVILRSRPAGGVHS